MTRPDKDARSEKPESCCKNVDYDSFRPCGKSAAHWYMHNEEVCSYCDEHDYQCGEPLRP